VLLVFTVNISGNTMLAQHQKTSFLIYLDTNNHNSS